MEELISWISDLCCVNARHINWFNSCMYNIVKRTGCDLLTWVSARWQTASDSLSWHRSRSCTMSPRKCVIQSGHKAHHLWMRLNCFFMRRKGKKYVHKGSLAFSVINIRDVPFSDSQQRRWGNVTQHAQHAAAAFTWWIPGNISFLPPLFLCLFTC